jgi:hypothetical protein
MTERTTPLTHVASGCGNIIEDLDTVIYIGDLTRVDCPVCVTRIEEDRVKRSTQRLATARTAAEQAVQAIIYAQSETALSERVDWTQVARDALTDALTTLEGTP